MAKENKGQAVWKDKHYSKIISNKEKEIAQFWDQITLLESESQSKEKTIDYLKWKIEDIEHVSSELKNEKILL
mgnify:CR=1 FL=1